MGEWFLTRLPTNILGGRMKKNKIELIMLGLLGGLIFSQGAWAQTALPIPKTQPCWVGAVGYDSNGKALGGGTVHMYNRQPPATSLQTCSALPGGLRSAAPGSYKNPIPFLQAHLKSYGGSDATCFIVDGFYGSQSSNLTLSSNGLLGWGYATCRKYGKFVPCKTAYPSCAPSNQA